MSIMTKDLGVVNLIFDKLNLGKTTGGTTWTIELDEKEIQYDQNGTKPADLFRTGISHKITTSLSQTTIEILKKVDRNFKSTGANKSINFSSEIFTSSLANAKTLVLADMNDNSTQGKIKFYLACPKISGEMGFGPDQQKMYAVEFYCFRDETYDSFGYFGDPGSLAIGSIDGE